MGNAGIDKNISKISLLLAHKITNDIVVKYFITRGFQSTRSATKQALFMDFFDSPDL